MVGLFQAWHVVRGGLCQILQRHTAHTALAALRGRGVSRRLPGTDLPEGQGDRVADELVPAERFIGMVVLGILVAVTQAGALHLLERDGSPAVGRGVPAQALQLLRGENGAIPEQARVGIELIRVAGVP